MIGSAPRAYVVFHDVQSATSELRPGCDRWHVARDVVDAAAAAAEVAPAADHAGALKSARVARARRVAGSTCDDEERCAEVARCGEVGVAPTDDRAGARHRQRVVEARGDGLSGGGADGYGCLTDG